MQDQKNPLIPSSIRFLGVHSDSGDPGYKYITFEMSNNPSIAAREFPYYKDLWKSQSNFLRFRVNEADKSKLEYAIVEGKYLYKIAPNQPYYPCPKKSWQHALLTTWEYYKNLGMSYCQKAMFSLTINDNGTLSVVLVDSDGGLHPPKAIYKNDKGETVEAWVMPSEPRPETFEIENTESESQLTM